MDNPTPISSGSTVASADTERLHAIALYGMTILGFALTAVCFEWFLETRAIPLLLLGLVTFGMAYDFLSHVLGMLLPAANRLLAAYARVNYWALCFGIPFTAYAGTFVMAEFYPDSVSATLARWYLPVLHGSLLFGSLFLLARYKRVNINGATEFVLDKSHSYTRSIFIARRALLALSLVVALVVMYDSWNTEWFGWAAVFTGIFVASIPLHIMHRQIPSMLAELLTQATAMYGSWWAFVAH